MAIPEQVRKQTEAVQAIYAELNPPDPPAGTGGEAATDDTPPADSVTAPAAVVAGDERLSAATHGYAELEQKYRSLQGTYNGHVGKFRADNQQLATRVAQLEQLLASVAEKKDAKVAAASVTDKDVEEYGESIEVMRRVASDVTAADTARMVQMEQQILQLQTVLPRVEQIAQHQTQSAERAFWDELDSRVPRWKEVNADQRFHNWLLEVDMQTGLRRQTALDEAQRNLDYHRVAQFFSLWGGQIAGTEAQVTRTVAASELEKQVSPGRGRASTPTTTGASAKTYTPDAIAAFFRDVSAGKYRGKEADRDRTERDIFAAQREGRVLANS